MVMMINKTSQTARFRCNTSEVGRSGPVLNRRRSPYRKEAPSDVLYALALGGRVSLEVDFVSNQAMREGSHEADLVRMQAHKKDADQPSISSVLHGADIETCYDTIVVGAGPAGLFLASELGKRGLRVLIVGNDAPIVNNYGVWSDEFEALGLSHTLECTWPDAACYFGEGREVRVGRGYGRVSRRKLRQHLLTLCKEAGVAFMDAEVTNIEVQPSMTQSSVTTTSGSSINARLVTVAAGAAAGKFLKYEEGAPTVAAQTAYGIEAEVEGYNKAYLPDAITFMDFRRHHSGVWNESAQQLEAGKHPAAGDGMWGSSNEVPSFLYAMPLGGNRVFLEETCLVAKPALPFSVLKRRLERRMRAVGIKVLKVHEEEWSYIPVGGPLPVEDQSVAAFGAAASLIHPATGFSVSRSFREAPRVADEIQAAIKEGLPVPLAAKRVWQQLWPSERRAQGAFHVFGMELLASFDLKSTNNFFDTFFRLPSFYWRGFLASKLTPTDLVGFALFTFLIAGLDIKLRLVQHLITDPAGVYLYHAYKAFLSKPDSTEEKNVAVQKNDV
ncbi:hypothetical protein CEUSTIGMA_g8401.t1 [Chlamydomonas eustigma]|uniref:Lycopene epsilon cyclase n=1 Tax=Chlamydomonas eustigma TaxID=1157962 RepID=A0A250XD31_9CHLO|nr:hypothetical protein CEUSTIGMA_g8401.t1 [Chlamydomonas eustigma]|eukprot:GAX80966.1 hypothetical protein CEUSTIGMA_g8401.t1 [Chlamydomonas eustigma]